MLSLFEEVNWLDTAYVVGQNTEYKYNAWSPGNAAYDRTRGVVVFLQMHANSHADATNNAWRSLCTVNPYRPMDYTMIETFPDYNNKNASVANSVGGLVVDDDGTWHVYGKTYNYHSIDGGKTWATENVVTKPSAMYGVTKIDGILYSGDDQGTNGGYFISADNGLNWETKIFDFADDYPGALTCCEASFCKFQGKIYANLRREDSPGIFARLDDDGWVVINEEMHNVRSDTTMYAVNDAIYMAAIDRPNRKLILASYDGNNVSIRKEYEFHQLTSEGDFHTPTYVVGDDFQMVTFMTGYGQNNYLYAVNACMVGYKNNVEFYAPTYNTEAAELFYSDFITDGPMTGTITENENGGHILSAGWYNVSKQIAGIYPPNSDGYPIGYGYSKGSILTSTTASSTYNVGQLHVVEYDGTKYLCFGFGNNGGKPNNVGTIPSQKLMGRCVEGVLENTVNMTGAQYCFKIGFTFTYPENGQSDFAKTAIVTHDV